MIDEVEGARQAGPATLSGALAAEFVAHRVGDRDAMDRLVRRVTPVLWHAARACGADRMTAEDAVQNALLAFVNGGHRIDRPGAVLRWLLVTVQREAIRLGKASSAAGVPTDVDDDVPAAPAEQPEAVQLARDRDSRLWAAVSQLSARCQKLLRMVAFLDRPDYAAVGEALGMPIGSIGPTRQRCLGKLRDLLGEHADAGAW